MIDSVSLRNFGPLQELEWDDLGAINLVLGENGSGKTFLLKALYTAVKTLEAHKRGDDRRSAAEILIDKLYWTFQEDKVGDLVSKGASGPLRFGMVFDDRAFRYEFGRATAKQITSIENHVEPRPDDSVFLPAKEVLSLHQVILSSRERDKVFGFDDTYYDLARMLQQPRTRGRNYKEFAESRRRLEAMFEGRVAYDARSREWVFKTGNQRFSMGVTAEGVKKIGILDTLLGNRTLTPRSIVFFDEPESAMHPRAISDLLDIVATLSRAGIQFFLASHSYFVVKKLYLVAQENALSIPVLSLGRDGAIRANLRDGMPDNPIIDESIRLYEEEVEMAVS